MVRFGLTVMTLVLAVPGLAFAAGPTPKPTTTPAPAATPTSTPSSDSADDLPTMTDGDPVPAAPTGDPEWDEGSSAGGILLGLRAGFHAFSFADFGVGGLAFEVTGAMPVKGPWYAAVVAGYHTGFTKAGYDQPDPKQRFFDTQFGAIEGQYRKNIGRVNLIGGAGLGMLTANSAEVTLEDGSPAAASGSGPVGHVLAGAFVPVGRFGVVGQVKYSVAQVEFKETDETLGMGGITLAAGVDFAF